MYVAATFIIMACLLTVNQNYNQPLKIAGSVAQ